MFNAKFWNEKQIFLNSSTWKFNKEDKECVLMTNEKFRAFVDPVTKLICLKFISGVYL